MRWLRRGAWLHTVLIGIDITVNAILGGKPYETLSLRFANLRAKGARSGCIFCSLIDMIDRDHCHKTLLRAAERTHV